MDFISSIISEELVYALGWTVVHSLWQAIGVAFIMGGLLLALQKHSSEVRYRLAYGALLVVLTMAVFTFFDLYQFARHKNVIEITQLSVQASSEYAPTLAEIPATATLPQRFTSYFNTHLPLIVSVWLLGLSLFVIRLLGGLAYLEHLKIAYTYQLETHWEDMLQYLAEQLPIKRTVELMESALVQVPIVVGHFKPIILMPVGAVNGLAVEQVEAILAHELAHIARNDYILNVVQSVIEALLYFNPAVWWISANIRTERENCCDDVAIQLCGNKLNYAKALVAIQEMNQSAPSLAMAFGKKKGQFLNRIRRILNQPQNKSDMIEKITATFCCWQSYLE
ncbi:MAG: M56 family metallopeptidase [Saprospiraceae bacterium]|nr:M56 family metallopeptidase [Saprospiraceae bacterium]